MEKSSGILSIRTYAASEAIPIEGVNIIIEGTDDVSRDVFYSVITDIDGVTPRIPLPTPSISYSLSPSSKELPYSTYDITATKDGYQSKTIRNVAIFAERDAVLPINMIPSDGSINPRGNSNAIITENESLQ